MTPSTLAVSIRPLLLKVTQGKAEESALLAAAGSDEKLLAGALWQIVADGDAALLAKDRRFLEKLAPYQGGPRAVAGDFLSLLRALAKARPKWLTAPQSHEHGLVYAGWSIELEEILDRVQDARSLAEKLSPPLPEPVASSLSFALARRGLPAALPKGALERFAGAFLTGYSPDGQREQFTGVDRVLSEETWAKAIWQATARVKEISVWVEDLAPLVRYATEEQLVAAATRMVWDLDDRVADWLLARGDAIVPYLEGCARKAMSYVRRGGSPGNELTLPVGVLARIRRQKGQDFPSPWMPLAKTMVDRGSEGVRDVLALIEPETREKMLLERLDGPISWDRKIDPVAWFPTERLVRKVVQKAKKERNHRSSYLNVLSKMGEPGQAALLELVGARDLNLRIDALHRLAATAESAPQIAALLSSRDEGLAVNAFQLMEKLDDEPFFKIMRGGDIAPGIAARLLASRHHHPQTATLAEALPDTEETRPHRAYCLFRPAPLAALSEAMYQVDEKALKKAETALAPLFKEHELSDRQTAAALRPMRLADLPAMLRASVLHARGSRFIAEALSEHFAARPDTAWAAVMWWSRGDEHSLWMIASALGAAIAEPLRARLELGMIKPEALRTALELLARHDPAGAWQSFTSRAADKAIRPAVVGGICAALAAAEGAGAEEAPVRRWLAASLDGGDESVRDVALEVLGRKPDAGLLPALERLRAAELSPATRRLLDTALSAFKAAGGPRERSPRALAATQLHKLKGPIRSIQISFKGKVFAAHAAGTFHLWRGKREVRIADLGDSSVQLSLGGRYVLVQREYDVAVYEPFEDSEDFICTLSPGDGFGHVEPLHAGRAATLCAANNNTSPLECWDLATADGSDHSDGLSYPCAAAPLDKRRYIAGGMAGDVAVLDIESGEVLIQVRADNEGDSSASLIESVCAGAGQVMALDEAGTLRFWAIDGDKAELLAEHVERARGSRIAADRRSPWSVTLHADHVQPWKSGQPARPLPADPGPKAGYEDRRPLAFVRPGVLAVGGTGVDLWDLEKGEHLGRLDHAVTALCAQGGKLYAGDAKGRIFLLREPTSR